MGHFKHRVQRRKNRKNTSSTSRRRHTSTFKRTDTRKCHH